jgi:ketosteroid isomerase-like protein
MTMGIAENKQIVLDFYEAGARGDMDACFALLADDITWTNIGTTKFSGTYAGKQALVEQLLEPLFGQLKAGIASAIERLTR